MDFPQRLIGIHWILLIVRFKLIECPRKESCNCPMRYNHPDFLGYCMTNGNFLRSDQICERISDMTSDSGEYPYTAVDQPSHCGPADQGFGIYLEMQRGQTRRKVQYGIPLARHKMDGYGLLFVRCRNSTDFADLHYTLSTIVEVDGQVQKLDSNYCEVMVNLSELLPLPVIPLTISTVRLTFNANPMVGDINVNPMNKAATSQTVFSLVNFPTEGSHLNLSNDGCTLVCSVVVKTAEPATRFRIRFTLMKDSAILYRDNAYGRSPLKEFNIVAIGKYKCVVNVLYRSCPPFDVLHNTVHAETEVQYVKEREKCRSGTDDNEKSSPIYRTILASTSGIVMLVGLLGMLIVYCRIRAEQRTKSFSVSSKVPWTVLEKNRLDKKFNI